MNSIAQITPDCKQFVCESKGLKPTSYSLVRGINPGGLRPHTEAEGECHNIHLQGLEPHMIDIRVAVGLG